MEREDSYAEESARFEPFGAAEMDRERFFLRPAEHGLQCPPGEQHQECHVSRDWKFSRHPRNSLNFCGMDPREPARSRMDRIRRVDKAELEKYYGVFDVDRKELSCERLDLQGPG